MKTPEPTPVHELLELAGIDALGLLDEEDHAAFVAGLESAPATLRELIIAEQARVAAEGLLLPDAEPGDALRRRVLGRITAGIESGRRAEEPAPARAVSHTRADRPSRPPRLQRARRVSPAWRISSISLAVAVVVLSVLHVQLKQEFDDVRDGAQISMLIGAVGVDDIEATLFDASSRRYQFTPVGDVGRARAMLWHLPDNGKARLYIANFPTVTGYRLVVLGDDDRPIEELASFEADGLLSGVDVAIDRKGPVRLAILTDEDEPRVLFVARIRLA